MFAQFLFQMTIINRCALTEKLKKKYKLTFMMHVPTGLAKLLGAGPTGYANHR